MKATYKNFIITAVLKASGVSFPFEKNGDKTHNKFQIKVENTETQETVKFNFYGSTHDFENGVKKLPECDLLNAFYCLVSDGLATEDGFDEFCSEYGYDTDSRTAHRIYKGCVKQFEKAQKIAGEANLYDLTNELQEVAG